MNIPPLINIKFIIIFVIIILRKEDRLKAFENKELRRNLDLRERGSMRMEKIA
jgi:hypothetical protein